MSAGGEAGEPAATPADGTREWVAEQVAKFEPDDLRRAAVLLTSLALGVNQ